MNEPGPFRWLKTGPEIICPAVMRFVRSPLSLRNVEDLLHERGVDLSHETVRVWRHRFSPILATETRTRRIEETGSSRWRWHLDEMLAKINGEMHYLWRAVDHEGGVLERFADHAAAHDGVVIARRQDIPRHWFAAHPPDSGAVLRWAARSPAHGLIPPREGGRSRCQGAAMRCPGP